MQEHEVTAKHPNVEQVEGLFEAYAARDFDRVRDILAPDVEWFTPGHHPLAGIKCGVDEVLAFFDQLPKAKFSAQPLCMVASGEYVVDCHRGWSEEGPGVDNVWCLLYRFERGRIRQVTNLTSNQHTADLFFQAVYQLKPIPERLAT